MMRLYAWAWRRALMGRTGALTLVFQFWIPFNRPHRFRIVTLTPGAARVVAPFRRSNRNHLGTVHACALATIGEFAAGLALLGAFDPADYRLIMSRLEVDYTRRAGSVITSAAELPAAELDEVRLRLEREGVARRVVVSRLVDSGGEEVAVVKTHWQIKDWRRIREKG